MLLIMTNARLRMQSKLIALILLLLFEKLSLEVHNKYCFPSLFPFL